MGTTSSAISLNFGHVCALLLMCLPIKNDDIAFKRKQKFNLANADICIFSFCIKNGTDRQKYNKTLGITLPLLELQRAKLKVWPPFAPLIMNLLLR